MTYEDAERLSRKVEKLEEGYRYLDRQLKIIEPLLMRIRLVRDMLHTVKKTGLLEIKVSVNGYTNTIETETAEERSWLVEMLQKKEASYLEELEEFNFDF